jgi:large subunit ribosomal protein L22
MVTYSYAVQKSAEMALALGHDLGISTKDSIEICSRIRGKKVGRAKVMLESAVNLETPIKYTRFSEGASHKPGMGMGKYPVKASRAILALVKSAEANAQIKGLGKDLMVAHALAQKGAKSPKYGRHLRRSAKRTHVEIGLVPVKKIEKKEITKKETKA